MKKIFAIILALALVLSIGMLAACKKGDDTTADTTAAVDTTAADTTAAAADTTAAE